MDQLRAMRAFVAVIEAGSFNGAAGALHLSPAAVTRQIAELEDHLGARLINRTTRRLALTDIGEAYLDKVRQILADVDEAEALAGNAAREPRGLVRVLAPPAFAVHQIACQLPRFRARYPQVSIELTVPGAVNAVDESHDVSVLMVEKLPEGEYVAKRLARSEFIICAAPDYLDRAGRPAHPRELAQHDALLPAGANRPRELTFRRGDDADAAEEVWHSTPRMSALHTWHVDVHYEAALAGLGIAGLPSFVVGEALRTGRLERVLPGWHLFSAQIYAGFPTRKHIPARTRAFIDFLIERFGGEDRDPWLAAAGCETPGRQPRRAAQKV